LRAPCLSPPPFRGFCVFLRVFAHFCAFFRVFWNDEIYELYIDKYTTYTSMYFEDPQIFLNRKYYQTPTDKCNSLTSLSDGTTFNVALCDKYCDTNINNIKSNESYCLCCNDKLRHTLGKTIETKSSNKALYQDSIKKYSQYKLETYNLGLGIIVCSILSYYYISKYTI